MLKLFNNEYDDECNERMSQLFGLFISNLPLEKQRKQFGPDFLKYFLKISRSQELAIRRNAAFNLPCVFYYYQNYCSQENMVATDSSENIDLFELYVELANDDKDVVKVSIGKGIHEILELEQKSNRNPFEF